MHLIKKLLSAAVCAGVLASAFIFPASAQLSNFTIVNSGFEDIRTNEGTNWPVKWDGWPSAGDKVGGVCTYQVTTADKHSGKSSLQFKLSNQFNQAAYEYYLEKDKPFNFDSTYIVSCWVKLANVQCSTDGVSMGIQRKGADGNRYDIICEPVTGTSNGWEKLQVEVTKPITHIVQFDFIVKIAQGSGTVYVDDFDIQPYTPVSSKAAVQNSQAPAVSSEAAAATTISSAPISTAPISSDAGTPSSVDEEAGVSSVSELSSPSSAAPAAAGSQTSPVLIVVITVAAVIAIEAVAGSVILLTKKGFKFPFHR